MWTQNFLMAEECSDEEILHLLKFVSYNHSKIVRSGTTDFWTNWPTIGKISQVDNSTVLRKIPFDAKTAYKTEEILKPKIAGLK